MNILKRQTRFSTSLSSFNLWIIKIFSFPLLQSFLLSNLTAYFTKLSKEGWNSNLLGNNLNKTAENILKSLKQLKFGGKNSLQLWKLTVSFYRRVQSCFGFGLFCLVNLFNKYLWKSNYMPSSGYTWWESKHYFLSRGSQEYIFTSDGKCYRRKQHTSKLNPACSLNKTRKQQCNLTWTDPLGKTESDWIGCNVKGFSSPN